MADDDQDDPIIDAEILADLRSDSMNRRLRAILTLDARRAKRAKVGSRIFGTEDDQQSKGKTDDVSR